MTEASVLQQKMHGFPRQVAEELSALKGEPDWLRQRRLAAWQAYEATPLPTLEDEDWRRTDISVIPFQEVAPYNEPPQRAVTSLEQLPAELRLLLDVGEVNAGHLVQHDSEVVYASLADGARQDGAVFTATEGAARELPQAERYLLGEAFPPSRGKFAALNAALFSGGAFIYVPEGVEVVLPLRATYWLSRPGLALIPHTVIVLEPGAKAIIIEEYFSRRLAEPSLVCPGVEVYLGQESELRYISIQQLDSSAFILGTHRNLLDRGSRLEYLAVALGGRLTKFYTDIIMAGEGSSARMLGVVFGDGEQHFDHQTLQEHIAPNASSDLLFKVAVKDQAMSVHYGMVHVGKGARGTDAGQTVRNLILSEGAKAHPILPLEIEASDIRRCAHAAAIGQVDENQLFYLMSRGLSRRQAEKLVVDGFFGSVLEAMPLEGAQARLQRAIDAKLPPD